MRSSLRCFDIGPVANFPFDNSRKFWVCVCSLRYSVCNAHAPCCIVARGLSGCTVFFHIISYTARLSGGRGVEVTEHKMLVWIFCTTLSQTFLILRRIKRDNIIYVVSLHVQYWLFLYDFNETWIFLICFEKNTQMSNSIKIRPVRAELFHADRRTDGHKDRHNKGNSRFSQIF